MKVFLTGATGFVGSHVARVYADAGAELRLLTRSSSNLASIEGMKADVVVGDLREPEGLRSAICGCEAVVHVAADYRLWVRDPKSMYAANVDGTRELLRIARESDVRRVVYTSSVATMGFRSDGTIANENSPVSINDMIGHYKRSKFLGELEAIKAARAGQEVMILNPTTPIGPGDVKPTPTGRIVVDFLNKKFPAYVDTGLNLVDVNEVARMHLVALDEGTPGERYILGGENLTLKQILDRMSAITGLPSPTMKVPHAVAMAFAFFDENFTGKILGKEPRATVEAVRMGKKMMFASSAKAEREIGFKVLPVYGALRSAIEWFVEHGYAPKHESSPNVSEFPAIIAALPRELERLVRKWKRRELPGKVFVYTNGSAVAACAGMGKSRVALAVEAAMKEGPVTALLSVGLAGACDPALRVGEIVRAGEVIDSGTGERYSNSQARNVLVTTPVIASVAEKRRLYSAYGAAAVDMEAATVARIALGHGLYFRAIKVISDESDFEIEGLSKFATLEGQFREAAFAMYAAGRPHLWKKLITLAGNSRKALVSLTDALHGEMEWYRKRN